MAVEVADRLQSMGIGTALARHLVERVRASRFTLLAATTLWENLPARAPLRGLGFHARTSHGSEIELELELEPAGDCPGPAYTDLHPTSPGASGHLIATQRVNEADRTQR